MKIIVIPAVMLKYLKDKAEELKLNIDIDAWRCSLVDGPKQGFGTLDCGIFAMMFADYQFDDLDIFEVCAENIEFFRLKMASDILRKELLV
jgi:Ulp1 family protease